MCLIEHSTDMFFCMDCTSSMGEQDSELGHPAHSSIWALVNDIAAHGIRLRLGGIKFNEGNFVDAETLDAAQFAPITEFTSVDDWRRTWLYNAYSPTGGDAPELQLDALYCAAQEMAAHATSPQKFIVLVTDNAYHDALNDGGYHYTKDQVTTELTNSGCPVFISLWDTSVSTHDKLQLECYSGLNVNGGKFDPADYSDAAPVKYPFVQLRTHILNP